jgi:hypothetical protein
MDTSRIGKIEKAKRYAEEPERFHFESFTVAVRGDNDTHTVTYHDGKFESSNDFFRTHGYSAHTIAIERLLKGMISPVVDSTIGTESSHISKIEKAKRYAEERDRFMFHEFVVKVRGDNDTHTVTYRDGKFESDNAFFQTHGYSAHTMAVERVLRGMIPSPAEEVY